MPLFTTIATAIFAGTVLAGTFIVPLTAFALQMAVGIGLNLLMSALAGKPKEEKKGPGFSVQGKLQAGGDVPRSFILGYGPTAGSLVYANTWGTFGDTPNAFVTQVIQVSDLPVTGLAAVWVNGEEVTLLTGEPHAEYGFPVQGYRKDGHDYLWIKFYAGAQTTADSYLINRVSSVDRPWTSTRVGYGCAYVIATALVSDSLFTGFPTFKFALNGVKLYDPSKDSTVGGSGTHLYSDPSTWGGDGDNLPAVQMYNVLRGFSYNGDWLYGLQGLSAARLPAAHWIAQINKCRALITGPDGDEATYRSGGQFAVNAQIATAIEALNTSCQGRLAEIGGIYKLHLGAPDASVFSFTDADIISTAEQRFDPFFGLADSVNGVAGKYPNPEEGWNLKPAPPIYRPDFELEDANRRLMADVSFDLVPYFGQVQRLMNSALEEARRARRHTHVLPPEAWVLEPGDVITWSSDRNSYSTKLFRVDGVSDLPNLDVMIDMTEVDPSDYNPPTYKTSANAPTIFVRPPPQPIVDWSAQPWTLTGDDGSERPAIKLNWDGDQPDVDAVLFQVRLKSSGELVHDSNTNNVAAGSIIITQSLIRNTEYEARGRYLAISGRDMLWSGWLDVKTPNTHIASVDLGVGTVRFDHLGADADQIFQNELPSIIDNLVESGIREDNEHHLKQELGGARAQIYHLETVIAGQSAAFAQTIEQLQAEVDENADGVADSHAGITTVQTVAADADAALASLIIALQAAVGDVSASATLRFVVGVAPPGVAARIQAEARVDTGGSWESAGWVIDVVETSPGSGTYTGIFRVFADKFQVINSTTNLTPFEVDTVVGVIRMMATRIKTVIQSDNYAEDAQGKPTAGWKIDASGTLKAMSAVFREADIGASALASITTIHPVVRRGVTDRTLQFRIFQPTITAAVPNFAYYMDGTLFVSPDAVTYSGAFGASTTSNEFVRFVNSPVGIGPGAVTRPTVSNPRFEFDAGYKALQLRLFIAPITAYIGVDINPDGTYVFYLLTNQGNVTSTSVAYRFTSPVILSPLSWGALATGLVLGDEVVSEPGFGRRAVPLYIRPGYSKLRCTLVGGGGASAPGGHAPGGPGGLVKFTVDVTPGEWLTLIVGSGGRYYNGAAAGFGGIGTELNGLPVGQGGGATALFRGDPSRTTCLGCAGGGGAGGTGANNGGPGGDPTDGGQNGGSGSGIDRMTGMTFFANSGTTYGAGGGGYEGGGRFTGDAGNNRGGRGGLNFITGAISAGSTNTDSFTARGTRTAPTDANIPSSSGDGSSGVGETEGRQGAAYLELLV